MAAAWWCVAGYKVWRNIHTCKQESKCLKKRYCIACSAWMNERTKKLSMFFFSGVNRRCQPPSHWCATFRPFPFPNWVQVVCLCSFLMMIPWFFHLKRAIFGKHFEVCPPLKWPQGLAKKPAVCGQFRRIFSRSSKKNLWIARSGNITSRWICSIPVPCILWSYLAPVFLEMSWSGEYKHQWHQRFNFAVEVYVLDGPSFEETYRQSGSELPRKAGAGFRTELV